MAIMNYAKMLLLTTAALVIFAAGMLLDLSMCVCYPRFIHAYA